MAANRGFTLSLRTDTDVKEWRVSEAASVLLFGDQGNVSELVSGFLEITFIRAILAKITGDLQQQAEQTFSDEVEVID